MTEKEKMLSGRMFDAADTVLTRERARAKALCQKLNAWPADDLTGQRALLCRLLRIGETDAEIVPPFWCDYGYNIVLGERFYANHNCVMLDGAQITFGDHVLVGPDCGFYTAGHPLSAAERRWGMETDLPITVGNDVWIGGGVRILPGVTIGDGSVIGAGSVVTRDIPAGVLAFGNPCRVIRPLAEGEDML